MANTVDDLAERILAAAIQALGQENLVPTLVDDMWFVVHNENHKTWLAEKHDGKWIFLKHVHTPG